MSSPPKCVTCHWNTASIGSRCEWCYVRYHAIKKRIWDLAWFQRNYTQFASALAARFWTMQNQSPQLPAGDIEELVTLGCALFNRKKPTEGSRQKIREIILAADRLVIKKENVNEGSRSGSEEASR
jgi:hypothetical protein